MIFRRRESVVGLDVGPDAIRAVELHRTSRGREVAAIGREPMPRGSIAGGEIVDREAVTEAIRRTLDRRGSRTRRVAAAVAGKAVIVKRVTLPLMDEDDLAGSIRSEAEHYIPFDTSDVNLDYEVLQAGSDAANRASMDVLLVGRQEGQGSPIGPASSRAPTGCRWLSTWRRSPCRTPSSSITASTRGGSRCSSTRKRAA